MHMLWVIFERESRAGLRDPVLKTGNQRRNSPSRERFRPPSRPTFRFRVQLLGRLRPTGAPCSAQAGIYENGHARSRPSWNKSSAICGGLSADPGLPIPVRPNPPLVLQLEVELVRLGEPRRCKDLNSVRRVDELETPVGLTRGALEDEGSSPAASHALGPHVESSAVLLDVLAYARSCDDPHASGV